MPALFTEADLMTAVSDRSVLTARIALALLGLASVLPFLSPAFQAPIATFYGEAVAFALGLAAVALMATRSLWTGVCLPRIGLMFLGFAMLMMLQIALGKAIYGQLNLLGALYVLWAAALAMLANRLVKVFGAATFAAVLAWFLVAGTLISALIGLVQLFGFQTPLAPLMLPQIHGRIYANTGQPNHLASYLCIGLASAGYLWSTRRLGTVLAVAVSAVLLAVLATSGSRAVWLYAAAFVVFSLVMGLLRPSAEFKRLLIFSIAIVGGLLAAQWVMAGLVPQGSIGVETMGARVQTEGMSSPIRLHFWNEAWMMFRGAPLFGVGFKQFAWNHFLLSGQIPGAASDEGVIDHAHNLIFQIAAEFGVSGLIVLLGGLGWWGWSLRRLQIDPPLWWTAALLGVLGLHSMLEYPLWYAYFLGIAAVVMGAAEGEAPRVDDRSSGRLILSAAVLLGAFAFANVYRDYRVMQSLQRGVIREPTSASGPGDRSIPVMLDLQRSSLFAPFIECALARRMLLNREHLEDKIVLNRRAMQFQPSDDFAYRQALLLAMSGDVEGMRAQWNLAVVNYPNERGEVLKVAQELEKSGEAGMKELLRYAQRQDEKAEK
jgi:Virulence factor membrane-bound polymerase, C-terminal/O-Antigen ligase/Protein glycosylation ligase